MRDKLLRSSGSYENLYGGTGVSVFIGNATHLSSNCDTRLKTYGGATRVAYKGCLYIVQS